jgi:hypothetical protein
MRGYKYYKTERLIRNGQKAAAARKELDKDPYRTNHEISESVKASRHYYLDASGNRTGKFLDFGIGVETVAFQRKKHGYPHWKDKPKSGELLPGCLIIDCLWTS